MDIGNAGDECDERNDEGDGHFVGAMNMYFTCRRCGGGGHRASYCAPLSWLTWRKRKDGGKGFSKGMHKAKVGK